MTRYAHERADRTSALEFKRSRKHSATCTEQRRAPPQAGLVDDSQRNPPFNSNGCYSSRIGRVSVGLKAEIFLKWRSNRERFGRRGHNKVSFSNDQSEKLAVIRAKVEANGCSILVDFRKKGFYSYMDPSRFARHRFVRDKKKVAAIYPAC